jgi:hypothetical protein
MPGKASLRTAGYDVSVNVGARTSAPDHAAIKTTDGRIAATKQGGITGPLHMPDVCSAVGSVSKPRNYGR